MVPTGITISRLGLFPDRFSDLLPALLETGSLSGKEPGDAGGLIIGSCVHLGRSADIYLSRSRRATILEWGILRTFSAAVIGTTRRGFNLQKFIRATIVALGVTLIWASPAKAFDPADLAQLQATNSCPGCDLSGANLAGANLAGANLTGADLILPVLTAAVFCNTTMPDSTINNADCGSITIVKNTVGGNGTFDFTGDLGAFGLATSGATATTTFSDLASGPYSVTETAATGFDVTGLICNDGSTTTLGTATASIDLAVGEDVTCTFTNTRLGSITIEKNTVGGDGTFDFTGSLGAFGLTTASGTNSKTFDVLPGTYDVTETAQAGFDLTALSCDDGSTSLVTRTATIDITSGESVTCNFTNTADQGSITIVKETVGGDGTFGFNGALGAFSLTTPGATASQTFNVAPGTYAVTETAQAGFDLTALSCDDGSTTNVGTATATIDLADDENVICTFTNTRQGSITIEKSTVGGDGTFGFTGDLGPFGLTTVNATASTDFDLPTGTYDVTESVSTSFALTGLICDDGSTISIDTRTASVVLSAGEVVICTFTNTEVRLRTLALINSFLTRRADMLMEAGPTPQHYLDRFRGISSNGVHFAPLAFTEILNGGGTAAFDALLAPEDTYWAFWAEGTFGRYREGSPGTQISGRVLSFQGGLDYLFKDRLIVGLLVEADAARELSTDFGYQVEGLGWMVGPYGAI